MNDMEKKTTVIEMVLGKCRYCGSEVMYDSGETYTKCSCCGETLVITGFQNEQIKIQQALEERDQLKKRLEAAEKAIKAEQEKSGNAISGIAGLKDSAVRLQNELEENRKTLLSFENKWEQTELNKLVEQYHQAENLQLDMAFDKAEDEYRKVIVMGGKDPEVYWRIILCHYGVVYQKDNEGNRIPSILRPDLSSRVAIVRDLEGSYRSEADRKYYSAELNRINALLEKYRHCQMSSRYDVFISVKQKTYYNGKEAPTEDYKIGNDLFYHLTEMGLRVFNSEQQSCRKPGEEWEPYILAALLSSKVMIVVGTSTENMEAQWVQNEWRRFQWLQKEEEKKSGKTDRKLLCFIDNMTGYNLPKDLIPLQAIINKAGAYRELDKVIEASFPQIKTPATSPETNIESIRKKMGNLLAFRQYDLVKEEYKKVIRDGTYSLDATLGLCNVCARHELSNISMLENATFDLSQEEAIQIILENNKDQDDLDMIKALLDKNKKNRDKELPHQVSLDDDAREQCAIGDRYYHEKDYTQAAAWYWKSAEQGNAEAQNKLGEMYFFGKGVTQDYVDALAWVRRSADQGNACAQKNLGMMYQTGKGVLQDDTQAVEWYRKSAEQGNADAQYNLGQMYRSGCGVVRDYIQAVKWYRKSAEQGNADAQNNLGMMFRNGNGVVQDYAQAVEWYRKSAEQGNADGQYSLGYMFEHGYGVVEDYAQAVEWYQKSAEQGNADGQNSLGYMFEHGYEVVQDYTQAAEWYRKSAEQGNADGQNNLGHMFEHGYGVVQNYEQAVKWYRKSAEQGNADAQYNLGMMYKKEKGVPGGGWEDRKWFQKSAEQGNADAQYMLGEAICFTEPQQAVEWYRKSAEQGHAGAQNKLGDSYYRGGNYAEAEAWYRKSAELGNADAQYKLGEMYYNGVGVIQDYSQAEVWYRKSAEQGNLFAQSSLADMYFKGTGETQNFAEAIAWYRKHPDWAKTGVLRKVGDMYYYGNGVTRDYAEAEAWYRKSTGRSNIDVKFALRIIKCTVLKKLKKGIADSNK